MTMQVIKTVDLLDQQEQEQALKAERARRAAAPENLAAIKSARMYLEDGRRMLAMINAAAAVRAQLDELERRATAALEAWDGPAAHEAAGTFKARVVRAQLSNPSPAQPDPASPRSRPPAPVADPAGAGGQQEARPAPDEIPVEALAAIEETLRARGKPVTPTAIAAMWRRISGGQYGR